MSFGLIYPDDSGDLIRSFAYAASASADLKYIDWYNVVEGTTIGVVQEECIPFDGYVAEIGIMSPTSAGSTTIGIHKNGNTTPEETGVIVPPQAEPAGALLFDGSGHSFVKGDSPAISIDPTTGVGTVRGWIRFRRRQ